MTKTNVEVKLVGEDGNALAILSRVSTAMKDEGVDKKIINRYQKEAMSGDYNHLLQVTMEYVEVN